MAIVILVGMVFVALMCLICGRGNTDSPMRFSEMGSNKDQMSDAEEFIKGLRQMENGCHTLSFAGAESIMHLLEINPTARIKEWKIDTIKKFCFEILADDSPTKEISTCEAMKWLDIIIQREKKLMDAQKQREQITNLKHIAEHGLTTEQRLNAFIELKRIMECGN